MARYLANGGLAWVVACPSCDAQSCVIDSRTTKSGDLRRRRKCPNCGRRWSTIEVFLEEHKQVSKYDRNVLLNKLRNAGNQINNCMKWLDEDKL